MLFSIKLQINPLVEFFKALGDLNVPVLEITVFIWIYAVSLVLVCAIPG